MAMKGSIRVDARVRVGARRIPLAQLEDRLQEARKNLADFSVPHRNIATLLDRWVQLNFRSEGGKVGGWAPLKAGGRWVGRGDTRRFDTTAKILQDTGRLRISFAPFASRRSAGIGSDIPYARPHQRGTGRLPQRRMLPNYDDVEKQVIRVFEHHVNKGTSL